VYQIKIVTTPTSEEIKAFSDAIENNNFAEVKKLLKEGFNHNTILPTGYSPLEQTTQIDDEEKAMEIANLLISGGAKINPENGHSGPLHHAASEEGKSNLVKLLIEYGADVNRRGNAGSTPLHLATDIGNVDTVEYLLAYNADKEIKDIYGNKPENIINDNPWIPNKIELITALNNPKTSLFELLGNPLLLTNKRQETGQSNTLFLLKR
jgi:ankyrin repeat protein